MNVKWIAIVGVVLLSLPPVTSAGADAAPQAGQWHAWLDSPGGELPVGLELAGKGGHFKARLANGAEKIPFTQVTAEEGRITFHIDYYDARITATISEDGKRLDGEWVKTGRGGKPSRLPFHATAGAAPRFPDTAKAEADVTGRWSVNFSKSDEPAVGLFQQASDGTVTGTFMTIGGDYRYLEGGVSGSELRLSSFDGAQALLFAAKLQQDGTLKGDFWSRDAWHETWLANRDDNARLEGGFVTFEPDKAKRLSDAQFLDLAGRKRTLGEKELQGKARIIEIFGSWCPNCHDAAELLAKLDGKYHRRGLSILGMAFELTGDFQRNAKVVRAFADRHRVKYPIVIVGPADKDEVKRALPALGELRAYPTTLFIDSEARVRAIHTGFSGPATGAAYERLRAEFEHEIETLLQEATHCPSTTIGQ